MLDLIKAVPAFLFELTRGCPPMKRRPAFARAPLIIGHRGSPCHEIENTIPSCERAIGKDGANGLEIDLCLTSDGEVVLWHDWDPDSLQTLARSECMEPDVRCCPSFPSDDTYRRRVSQLCLDDVRSHFGYAEKSSPANRLDAAIPTFAEFMEWSRGQRGIETVFLDIKVPCDELEAVPRLMARVHDILGRGTVPFTVVFETGEPEVLAAMKHYSPTNCYTLDVGPGHGLVLRPERYSAVRAAIEQGNRYATLMYPRATVAPWTTFRRIVRHDVRMIGKQLDGNGRPVDGLIGFTVNEEEHMRCLLALGLDGMQTDRPDRLSAIVREMNDRIGKTGSKRDGRK